MKTAIALLALVAVAVANPVSPFLQMIVNLNMADVPASGVIDMVDGVQVVDVMPVVPEVPIIVAPEYIDLMPVVDVPTVITPVMPVVDPVPPSVELAPPVLPGLVQPEAAINLPEILN